MLGTSGCQVTYLLRNAYEQMSLLNSGEPIDEVIAKTKDPELKRKLELSKKVREFCIDQLGLKPTKNYTNFVQLDRDHVTYVVSAAKKQELTAYTWWYPIIGTVPYKGFFKKSLAEKEAEDLKGLDLDVYLRGVSAYSTLGWFKDPLLSSMTRGKDTDLVNTLIHETVHATLYVRSASDFNEQLASFLADKGTLDFYKWVSPDDHKVIELLENENNDSLLFSRFIKAELGSIKEWYNEKAGNFSESERLERLAEIQKKFERELEPLLKSKLFSKFSQRPLNNALLLQYGLYMGDHSSFEKLYLKNNSQFKPTLEKLKTLENSKNPEEDLLLL